LPKKSKVDRKFFEGRRRRCFSAKTAENCGKSPDDDLFGLDGAYLLTAFRKQQAFHR
jgi:hypothetical protein